MRDLKERRTNRRLLCAELVELIWRDHTGAEIRRIANLEDISSTGLCLQLETPIHAGAQIRMKYAKNTLTGMIRYTVWRDDAFFVGVELDEKSCWSVNRFAPSHLLDPQQLMDQVAAAGPLHSAAVSSTIH